MQEALALLYSTLWGVWRFRWVSLVVAWTLSVAGWITIFYVPDAYVATARVYVDSNTVLGPLLKGLAIQPNINQRIELMSRTLLSRPNMEKLMRMADLDLIVRTDLEQEEFLTELRESIALSGERGNNSLYSISFKNQDRDTAKRIVQALITVFIESSLGDKREDSSDAQSFLNQQIADYEVRLVEAETRLSEFRQRYAGSLPGETGDYYARLEQAQSQQNEAQLQLKELTGRQDQLRKQLSGEEPVFLSSGLDEFRTTSSPLDKRIQKQQASLDNLLSKYTERHPEVLQIRQLMADLQAQKEKELGLAGDAPSSEGLMGLTSSPAYQDMRTMLAETEASIAELNVRVEEYSRRVVDIQNKVNNVPVIETELVQLNRDYEVIKQQHTELLERRESAMISQKVEQNSNDVTFRVVDPPFVPLLPSEPNKLVLNVAVLFASIGVGLGVAFALSLIRPVFVDQRNLLMVTGLPFLGAVTNIPLKSERRKNLFGTLVFSTLCLFLVLTFVGVGVIEGGLITI